MAAFGALIILKIITHEYAHPHEQVAFIKLEQVSYDTPVQFRAKSDENVLA